MISSLAKNKDGIDALFKLFTLFFVIAVFLLVVFEDVIGPRTEFGLERFGVLSDQDCIGQFSKAVELGRNLESALPDQVLDELVIRCEIPKSDLRQAVEKTAADKEDAAADADLPNNPNVDQGEPFVAVGRQNPAQFSDVNFNTLADSAAIVTNGPTFEVGDKLMARWSVNLRTNTSVTTGGQNPSVGVVNQGQCVKTLREPEVFRGQYWVKVEFLGPC